MVGHPSQIARPGRCDGSWSALSDGAGQLASAPLRCWIIEGKFVRPEAINGEVVRLGAGRLDARLETELPPLTNVRLRLNYPTLAQESADLYGKVVSAGEEAGGWSDRIGLTSVDAADQEILGSFLRATGSPAA